MPERWTRDSWRQKPIAQVPEYPDQEALASVERRLASFPPLVFAGEARSLKKALGRVAAGEGFLLHGGDFAEAFTQPPPHNQRAHTIPEFSSVLPPLSAGLPQPS